MATGYLKVSFFFLALSCGALAGAANYFPSDAFKYPDPALDERPLDEEKRTKILSALSDTNRDAILEGLVPSRVIAGEKWFDLRGIRVRAADLDKKANLIRICWDKARFEGCDLSGIALNGPLLRGVIFSDTDLSAARIDEAHLQDAKFERCEMTRSDFHLSHMDSTTVFNQCQMTGARFENADATGSKFLLCKLQTATFHSAQLGGAEFMQSDLSDADLTGADIKRGQFFESVLDGTDFTDANLEHANLARAQVGRSPRLVRTCVFGIFFGDRVLAISDFSNLRWNGSDHMVGEEITAARSDTDRGDKVKAYSQCQLIYLTLAKKYQQNGQRSEYLRFHYRFLEARRQQLRFSRTSGVDFEYLWLSLSNRLDRHGTSFRTLAQSFSMVIIIFAVLHVVCWFASPKMDLAVWYRTGPGGGDLVSSNGKIEEGKRTTPRQILTSAKYKGWRKLTALQGLLWMALFLSVEAAFLFSEKIVNLPNIFHLLRIKQERLAACSWARPLVGIEALIGAFFFYLAAKALLLFVGG